MWSRKVLYKAVEGPSKINSPLDIGSQGHSFDVKGVFFKCLNIFEPDKTKLAAPSTILPCRLELSLRPDERFIQNNILETIFHERNSVLFQIINSRFLTAHNICLTHNTFNSDICLCLRVYPIPKS